MKSFALLLLLAVFLVVLPSSEAKIREGDCQVCINTVQKFADHVKANKLRKDADIESGIKEVCASLTDAKEKRMCYYVGGSKDAASSMLRTLSKPLGFGLPAIKICDRLKKKDISICELSYPKPLVLSELEPLKKQRVKVLKKVLSAWGEKCSGCTSKTDYVNRINELRHKYEGKDEL